MFLGLVSSLLFLVVPIVLVVWAVRHFGNRSTGGGGGIDARSVRRFFQYLLLYGLMIVAAVGLSELLGLLFEKPALAGGDRSGLARALTFSVFGLPMFALMVAWSRRRLRADRDEARSLGWAFYATLAPLTALVVSMFALHDVASAALVDPRLDGAALTRTVVWAAAWFGNWTVAKRLLDADRRRVQLAIGSLIGLATTVAGLAWLLGASLDALLVDPAKTLVGGQSNELGQAAATVVVGVPVWVVYWLRGLATDRRSPLWFGYVLPIGVGGSLVLAVVGASIALNKVLVWFLGEPASTQAATHFDGTAVAGACVVVGAASWWYHRQVLAGATPERTEVTRVYEYLMSGIALLAAAVGVTMVIVALVESLLPAPAVEVGTAVVNSLLAGVTLLLVGGPLWWVFWSRIGRATRSDHSAPHAADADAVPSVAAAATYADELASPTRRLYLFVLFGLGGVAAVIAVLVAAFFGFQGALKGGFDAQVVRDMRIPVAILLATGAISGYHWAVYRDDRSRLPAASAGGGPRYVLLVGAPDAAVGRAVEHRTGARVEVWVRTDGLAAPWVLDDVVAAVRGSEADAVTVVAGPAGLEAIGMQRP